MRDSAAELSTMSDGCDHQWGPAELCETHLGEVQSPLCKHCGSVKLLVEEEQARRNHAALSERMNRLWHGTNLAPREVRVHQHQTEIFTEL